MTDMACIYILTGIACVSLFLPVVSRCPPNRSNGITHNARAQSLTSVPTNVPEGTQALLLQENLISSFQASDFSNVSDICNLYMGTNEIYTLPDRGFELLGELRKLGLNNNHLTEISNLAFDGLNNLQELHIKMNALVNISYAFEGLPNLMELYLNENNLQGGCQKM